MRNSDKNKRLSANQKGLLRLLAFSLVCVLLFSFASTVFHPKDGMDTKGYSRYVTYAYKGEPFGTVDVVFAGNSNVYRAFNPIQLWEEYGITSCDIGGPALTMRNIYNCLAELFETQQPKLIALEANCLYPYYDRNKTAGNVLPVFSVFTADAAAAAHTDPLSLPYVRSGMIKDKLNDWNDAVMSKIAYEAPLMKYHDRWHELTCEDFTHRERRYYLITKGFLYSTAVQPFYDGDTYMASGGTEPKTLTSGTMKYLKKIKELCDKNGAVFTVVCVPSGQNWNNAKHLGVDAACKKLGVVFKDYNTEIESLDGFDWMKDRKDFGDHLNIYGATKVTRAYGKLLAEQFGLAPSTLTEEQKAHWDSDAAVYHTKVDKR